jgi:hypothetical protein
MKTPRLYTGSHRTQRHLIRWQRVPPQAAAGRRSHRHAQSPRTPTQQFGFDERRARGIVELITSAEDEVITKNDLEALEERLKKMLWRVAVTILAANAGITAALPGLFGCAA